ncbi:MAG TPA: hypothetical protein VFL85_03835 [Candidatus Saccharimonadales bacterium]|nr:hypothetical protein [Candidatus Saccharimonadales bacterium]
MLSPETQARLDQARAHENDYRPNASISQQLGDKALVMVVAPAAIGKSTIMQRAVELSDDFAMVPVFSTRDARPDDDPALFRLSPHDDEHVNQLLNKIDAREAVQYAIHPTQGTIYGTEASDYPAKYNLLATLSNVVAGMRELPFNHTYTIGLITDANHWRQWFDARFPVQHKDRQKRLKEAAQSLEWLLADNQVLWLYNQPEAHDETARSLIDLVQDNAEPADLRQQATELLIAARELQA